MAPIKQYVSTTKKQATTAPKTASSLFKSNPVISSIGNTLKTTVAPVKTAISTNSSVPKTTTTPKTTTPAINWSASPSGIPSATPVIPFKSSGGSGGTINTTKKEVVKTPINYNIKNNVVDPNATIAETGLPDYVANEDAVNAAIVKQWGIEALSSPNIDEIRRNTIAQFQQQIDALKGVYADKLRETKLMGVNALGQNAAMQGRSGELGSTFANAENQRTSTQNILNETAVGNEESLAIGDILQNAENLAQDIYNKKIEARNAGGVAYRDAIKTKQADNKAAAQSMAKNLVARGTDLTKLGTADAKTILDLLKKYNISSNEFTSMYNDAKIEKENLALNQSKVKADIAQSGASTAKSYADISLGKEELALKSSATKEPTAEEVKQFIRKQMATSDFKDLSSKEKKNFILLNGGDPNDYNI